MRASDYSDRTGLQAPHAPTKAVAKFVREHFSLSQDDEVLTGKQSKHSTARVSAVGDVVLYTEPSGALLAGQVWLHVSNPGHAMTLVQEHSMCSEDKSAGTALFQVTDEYEFICTPRIVDPVVWANHEEEMIKAFIPPDVHMRP